MVAQEERLDAFTRRNAEHRLDALERRLAAAERRSLTAHDQLADLRNGQRDLDRRITELEEAFDRKLQIVNDRILAAVARSEDRIRSEMRWTIGFIGFAILAVVGIYIVARG